MGRKIRKHLDFLSVSRLGGEKGQIILLPMYNIFRLFIGVPDYSIVLSQSYGGKQKHVENDGHLNKQL